MNELPNEFDTAAFLRTHRKSNGKVDEVETNIYERKKRFKDICNIVKEDIQEATVKGEKGKVKNADKHENEWVERTHLAITGNESAINYFVSQINEVLSKRNLTSDEYPNFYNSLAEAIFHEVWGRSILEKWERYPDSEACVIRGQQLWFDLNGEFVKQKEGFESIEQVQRIKSAFLSRDETVVLNKDTPEAEIEREDGSRIAMLINPRSKEDYVMLRRFILKNMTLEEQAEKGTIPKEDIPIYRALAKSMANTIFAGRVRSAKSTMLKTFVGERDPRYVVACLEKHFELALTSHYPERLIFEIKAKEGDLHRVVPALLRIEHDYLIIGEIRSMEIEAYMMACERGERGALGTYHLTDSHHGPSQLTRHLLDEFPNRTFENEIQRVATNVDLIINMSTDRDRSKKRVMSVTEVIWDDDKREAKTHDLIRYSQSAERYYYSSSISDRLVRLMNDENPKETENLINLLKSREQNAPMEELYRNQKIVVGA